jgi:casein kinase I family protein HRR25
MSDIVYKMIISNKYEILEKIGEGCFGQIYKGRNIRSGENVAIKIEPIENGRKLLKNETKIYQYLAQGEGIPKIKWFGVDEKNNYMVITLLGLSLSDFTKKHTTISLNVVLQIGKQLVERLKFIHGMGLIHRDIKPDNFLIGENNIIFIIDFGLCKKYIGSDKHKHIENKKLNKIIGTPNFVSVNVHNLNQPSRRDDVESMVYVLLYLYFGGLDWIDFYDLDEIKTKKIELLENNKVPKRIRDILFYIRGLSYEENPDYEFILKLLLVE